jgi:hypothetical protein
MVCACLLVQYSQVVLQKHVRQYLKRHPGKSSGTLTMCIGDDLMGMSYCWLQAATSRMLCGTLQSTRCLMM